MNLSLLKKMLPGLIPLFVFILADEIWGTKIALYIALGVGMTEFIFYLIKDKKIDLFILLDTGLLLLLGAISIALDNDFFFKIKPAFIEGILLAIIAFSIWGPKNIIMAMSLRYMGDIHLNSEQEKTMRKNMAAMFWITVVHVILVLYSAVYMSKEAWAFISGGLFYIFFGVYFSFLLIKNKLHNRSLKKEEWFPIVNPSGQVIGSAPRSVCHDGKSMLLHPVVHLHLFNSTGQLFLQKRAMTKDIYPGKWDSSVGGHVDPGETIGEALIRETREELGLSIISPVFLHNYLWESSREKELVNSFYAISDTTPSINPDEIEEGKFWSLNQIKKNIGKNIFTPNFEHEFEMLLIKKIHKKH
jgi:isopentenyldiphosphate isomerase/intracellular septation protein A